MRKALIILTPGFPQNENDSTTMYSQQLFVRILVEQFPEIEPKIISLHYPYTRKKYICFGAEVIPLNGMRFPRLLRFMPWILALRKLKEIKSKYDIIGILSFWCLEPALIGEWFSKRNKIRHLIWILGQDARQSNWLVRFIRPPAKNLVSISKWTASEFENNHHTRPKFYIPNGIEPVEFSTSTKLKTIDILGVGSLVALKQYTVFIEVIASLSQSFPSLRAKLCGAGEEINLLKSNVEKMRLSNVITFQGELPHSEVLDHMQRSKILLHPSSYEGYSTACLEALYAGCHVVSFTKAEEKHVENWHVVSDATEMIETCSRILHQNSPPEPQLVHSMRDSVKSMIALFNRHI